jgi:hypothetical protein
LFSISWPGSAARNSVFSPGSSSSSVWSFITVTSSSSGAEDAIEDVVEELFDELVE